MLLAGGDDGGLIEGDNGAVVVLNQGTGSGVSVASMDDAMTDDSSVDETTMETTAVASGGESKGSGQNGEQNNLIKECLRFCSIINEQQCCELLTKTFIVIVAQVKFRLDALLLREGDIYTLWLSRCVVLALIAAKDGEKVIVVVLLLAFKKEKFANESR